MISFLCCELLNREKSEQRENAGKEKRVPGRAGWVITVEQKLHETYLTESSSTDIPSFTQ